MKDHLSVCKEAIIRETLLDRAVVVEIDRKGETRYNNYMLNKSTPELLRQPRTWGESGVIKMRTKATATLADRGVPCMMLG